MLGDMQLVDTVEQPMIDANRQHFAQQCLVD